MSETQSDRKREDASILVVEDSETQATWLRLTLEEHGFSVRVAGNGREALDLVRESKPTIIISDILMPEMDGYELCQHIKQDHHLKDTPVILLTLLSDPKDIIRGLECGADSFMTKPCEEKHLLARVQYILDGRHAQADDPQEGVEVTYAGSTYHIALGRQQIIDNLLFAYEIAIQRNRALIHTQDELRALNEHLEDKVRQRLAAFMAENAERRRVDEELKYSLDKLQRTFEETVQALASTSEKRDPYTAGHQQRVAELAAIIAGAMGLPEHQVEGVRVAGLLHDIGKVSIPAEILSKPGQLADMEFNIVKNHPSHGFDILKTIEFPWPIATIVLQHHERLDGSGYPLGLRGDEILLQARILAVADVIDAMVSHRPYRPAHGREKAIREIQENRGVLYDPLVVDACVRIFDKEDPGKCA